jgi:PRTRC genetic system protein B
MSDKVTIEKFKTLEPQEVIVTYEAGDTYYMELASVDKGRIGPFRPMGAEEMYKLGGLLMEQATKLNIGKLPRNLLYMDYNTGKYSLVWYTKPTFKKLYFKGNLNIPNGATYPVPGLVWKYHYGTLYLFAYTKLETEVTKTKLYLAPFHNIHSDHSVCMGSGDKFIFKVENTHSIVEFMKSVEEGFYKSFFTTMHAQTVVGNLNTLWKKMANKAIPFPESELIQTKKSFSTLFDTYSFRYDDEYDFGVGDTNDDIDDEDDEYLDDEEEDNDED